MKLSDKPCYPVNHNTGITFRERLITALAGNPTMIDLEVDYGTTAKAIINQADAIIKRLENEVMA